MKNNYKVAIGAFAMLLSSSIVVAQKSDPKPIKKVQTFSADQAKSVANIATIFENDFQLSNENTLIPSGSKTDNLGQVHQEYVQLYNGIKVEFGSTTAHSKDGVLQAMTNNIFRVSDVNTTPSISAAVALQKATSKIGATTYLWQKEAEAVALDYQKPQGELVVFPAIDKINAVDRLAYKFDIYATAPLYRADVYVDAQNGEVIFENKRIHHANTPVTGASLYNGTVSMTGDSFNGAFRLRQTADGGGIQTFDMNNGTNYSNASDITSADNSFPAATATGVQAHYGAEQTHKYFQQNHNRNSYNGAGAIIRSYVSYSSNYVNAFWDGSRMTYGDGDGVNYGPLVSLDIVGHEIAHGVTEFSANLVYSYQSGALNESFSDIFGESIEKYAQGTNDWLMGDAIGAGGSGGALRSMSNPNQYGDPDTYLGTNWYAGSGDNGGVHINSGVQNFWFYLLTTGGSGTNDVGDVYNVTAIGMEKAAAIAYRNLSVYLSRNSQYADARAGAIQSAIDLYGAGSQEVISTTNAWYAVNVGEAYDSTPPPPPTCYSGDLTLSITFDNYPEETAWTLKNAAGTTVDAASYSTANADGSTVSKTISGLAAGDYTFTITDAYGDGICCSYGNGSYTLTSSTGTVASGGSFGSSESTVICIEDGGSGADTQAPTAPTSLVASNATDTTVDLGWGAASDNVGVTAYNVYQDGALLGSVAGTSAQVTGLVAGTTYAYIVTAVDAAGNESATSNTATATTTGGSTGGGGPVVLNEGYFETGWDGWADGGSDSFRYAGSRSSEGTYSIRLRDNTNSSVMTLSNVDMRSYNSVTVDFAFYAYSMESGEDFWVQFYDGSAWRTVAAYARGTSFNNNTFYTASVTIDATQYTFAANAGFRFRCDASANADQVYIDSVVITADAPVGLIGDGIIALGSIDESQSVDFEGDLKLYPNPVTQGQLNVDVLGEQATSYRILNIVGQVVMSGEYAASLDVSKLKSGMYIVEVTTEDEVVTEKFIKK